MKVKTPKAKEVVEDPAVKAQRMASEKAAEEVATNAVSDRLRKKTRIVANVFGGPSAGSIAASAANYGSSGSSGSAPATFSPNIPYYNGGNIWKGGMY